MLATQVDLPLSFKNEAASRLTPLKMGVTYLPACLAVNLRRRAVHTGSNGEEQVDNGYRPDHMQATQPTSDDMTQTSFQEPILFVLFLNHAGDLGLISPALGSNEKDEGKQGIDNSKGQATMPAHGQGRRSGDLCL